MKGKLIFSLSAFKNFQLWGVSTRRKKQILWFFTVAILVFIFFFFSCNEKEKSSLSYNKSFLFINSHATGPYYLAASALARLITINADYIGVNSSIPLTDNEKIEQLINKKIDIAFLKGPEANLAYHGEPFYWKEEQPIRAMFSLWPAVYNLITYKDNGIKKIEDIKGKSIAIYSENSVNGDILNYFLELYGITSDNTTIYRVRDIIGINMFLKKEVDSIWYDIGYGGFNFSSTENFILIGIEENIKTREFFKTYPFFFLEKFGAEVGLPEKYQLMTACFAACSEDLSENDAYVFTKLWFENPSLVRQYISDNLDLIDDKIRGVPVPFHKGSLKYLKEAGLAY
ncbi:MAG: TAXI family TRAP transporter solute-binding subunit [Spirochaetaceae bacterium]|nr:TAXI family TRAP transporter solute-binding subunit [Spirochaetaceae bacterium]